MIHRKEKTKKFVFCLLAVLISFVTPVFASGISDIVASVIGFLVEGIVSIVVGILSMLANVFLKASTVPITSSYFQSLLGAFEFFDASALHSTPGLITILGVGTASILFMGQFLIILFAPLMGGKQQSSYIGIISRALIFIPMSYFIQPLALGAVEELQLIYTSIVDVSGATSFVALAMDGIENIVASSITGVDFGVFGDIAAFIIAGLLIILIVWNFVKLLFEMTQRFVVMIVYVYLSPLFAAFGACGSFAHVPKQAATVFLSSGLLWIMNAWVAGVALGLMGKIDTTTAENFFVWAIVCYGFMKIAQQLDDIFNAVGLTNVRMSGSMLDELLSVGTMAKGIGKIFDNFKKGYDAFGQNGFFSKSGSSPSNPTSASPMNAFSHAFGGFVGATASKISQAVNGGGTPAPNAEGEPTQPGTANGNAGVTFGAQGQNGQKPAVSGTNPNTTGQPASDTNENLISQANGEQSALGANGSPIPQQNTTNNEQQPMLDENGNPVSEQNTNETEEFPVDGQQNPALDTNNNAIPQQKMENNAGSAQTGEQSAIDTSQNTQPNGNQAQSAGQASVSENQNDGVTFGGVSGMAATAALGGVASMASVPSTNKINSNTSTNIPQAPNVSSVSGNGKKVVPATASAIGGALVNRIGNTNLAKGLKKTGQNLSERAKDVSNGFNRIASSASSGYNDQRNLHSANQMYKALGHASAEDRAKAMAKLPEKVLSNAGAKEYIGQQLGLMPNQSVTGLQVDKGGQLSATVATKNADGSTSYSNVSGINNMDFAKAANASSQDNATQFSNVANTSGSVAGTAQSAVGTQDNAVQFNSDGSANISPENSISGTVQTSDNSQNVPFGSIDKKQSYDSYGNAPNQYGFTSEAKTASYVATNGNATSIEESGTPVRSQLVPNKPDNDIKETRDVISLNDNNPSTGYMVTTAIDGGEVFSSVSRAGSYGGPDNLSKFNHQIGTDGRTTEFAAPSDWSTEQVSRCIAGKGSTEEQAKFESYKDNAKNMRDTHSAMAYVADESPYRYEGGSVVQGDPDTSFTFNNSGFTTSRISEGSVGGKDIWQTVDKNGQEVARGEYSAGTSAGTVARDIASNKSDYAKTVNNAASALSSSVQDDSVTFSYNKDSVAQKEIQKVESRDYSFSGGQMADGTSWSESIIVKPIGDVSNSHHGAVISYKDSSGVSQKIKLEPIGQVGNSIDYKYTAPDGSVRVESIPDYITTDDLLNGTMSYSGENQSNNSTKKLFGGKGISSYKEEVTNYRDRLGLSSILKFDSSSSQGTKIKTNKPKKIGKGSNSNNPTGAL